MKTLRTILLGTMMIGAALNGFGELEEEKLPHTHDEHEIELIHVDVNGDNR